MHVYSMTLDYHKRFIKDDLITRILDRMNADVIDVSVIASLSTASLFDMREIEYRVSYAPPRDFILFDCQRAISFSDDRALIYYRLYSPRGFLRAYQQLHARES